MTNKLHTAKSTQEIFGSIGQALGLQPYILSKLAIALSVKKGCIAPDDYKTDNDGLELSRQTIFGDHDLLFKALIINREQRSIIEEEYFPLPLQCLPFRYKKSSDPLKPILRPVPPHFPL